MLFYRECAELLRAAGAEHGNALVVNLSSISGKSGQPWLSVYSATKAGLIGFTQAMNKELNGDGMKSVALAPGFVDTPMTDFIKERDQAGGDDPHAGHRRGRPLPAAAVTVLRRPGDRLPASRRIAVDHSKIPAALRWSPQ